MKYLLLIVTIFFSTQSVNADQWYWAVGIGWHSEYYDGPEVNLGSNNLFRIRFVYEFGDGWQIEPAGHISAWDRTEDGYGLNTLFIEKTSRRGCW